MGIHFLEESGLKYENLLQYGSLVQKRRVISVNLRCNLLQSLVERKLLALRVYVKVSNVKWGDILRRAHTGDLILGLGVPINSLGFESAQDFVNRAIRWRANQDLFLGFLVILGE